jgi:PKD repeat protein
VNASSTTSTAPITSYSWSFGSDSNPSTATGVNATTRYSVAGSKVITLTVTDNAGRSAQSTKVITVSP